MYIDFSSSDLINDPFPYYEAIRKAGRCVWNEAIGVWMVTGYRACREILMTPRVYSSRLMGSEIFGPWYKGSKTMLSSDGAEHDRLRRPLQRAFGRKTVECRSQQIESICSSAIRDLTDREDNDNTVDLVASYAKRVAVAVLEDVLDLPAKDGPMLASWASDMALGSVAITAGGDRPDGRHLYERAVSAGDMAYDYLRTHVATAEEAQPEGLLQALRYAMEGGELSSGEVTAACVLFLLAGVEATVKLIANAALLLGENRSVCARIRSQPALIAPAVEEIMRLSGPAQFDPRLVEECVMLGGANIAEGDIVWMITGAANRDPEVFPASDSFILDRSPIQHLAFGGGTHSCIGAPLARLVARIALRCLLRKVDDYSVVRKEYGCGFFLRGPVRLDVVIENTVSRSSRSLT
jgi:cytochrome P450